MLPPALAPARPAAPARGRARLCRGRHLVVHRTFDTRGSSVATSRSPCAIRSTPSSRSMRPSLLPNLIERGRPQPRPGLGRGGSVRARAALHRRQARRAGLGAGRHPLRPGRGRHWATPTRPVDALDAKADARPRWRRPARRSSRRKSAPTRRRGSTPAARAGCASGRRSLATFGELHPEALAAFELALPVVAFELDLDALPLPKARASAPGRRSSPCPTRRSTATSPSSSTARSLPRTSCARCAAPKGSWSARCAYSTSTRVGDAGRQEVPGRRRPAAGAPTGR